MCFLAMMSREHNLQCDIFVKGGDINSLLTIGKISNWFCFFLGLNKIRATLEGPHCRNEGQLMKLYKCIKLIRICCTIFILWKFELEEVVWWKFFKFRFTLTLNLCVSSESLLCLITCLDFSVKS
jgi:hypothetical protein